MRQIAEPAAHYYADLATVATAVIAGLAAVFTLAHLFRPADRRPPIVRRRPGQEGVPDVLANPKFAEPKLATIDYRETFDGSSELFEQYEWFVDFMLGPTRKSSAS